MGEDGSKLIVDEIDEEFNEVFVEVIDTSTLAGAWFLDGEADATSSIEIDEFVNWALYERPGGDDDSIMVDYGTISAGDEDGQYYVVSMQFDDLIYDIVVADDGSQRYEPVWNDSENADVYYSWDSELCQRNVSEFEGVWYYDGYLSAETYIVIDDSGNWSYYQRAPGAEPVEMDCGIFSYSTDEVSTYHANSTMYDGLSTRVFEFDADVMFGVMMMAFIT